MATLLLSVVLVETFTRTLSDTVKEYCLREYFVASCPGVTDVILMTSALYGRMRIGRCIRGTFNIGCSNDVTALFDDRCSGRKSCNVSVRSLVDSRPCQRDFASYLEASYQCVPVYDLGVTSCPTSHVADVTARDSSSSWGYISNTLGGPDHLACGRSSCPWLVRGVPGQRVQLSVVVLGHLGHPQSQTCQSIVLAEPTDRDNLADVVERRTFNICSVVTRQRHLFTTSGHVIVAYTSTNGSGHGQGQDQDATSGRRFLLMYKILGCPRLSLAEGAHARQVEGTDDVIVACNGTLDTWYLTCQDNRWIGHFDNCTTPAPPGNYEAADINRMFHNSETYKLYFNNGGIVLALCLGLLLGIAIAVLSVTTLCCSRRLLCRRRRIDQSDFRVGSRDKRAVTSHKHSRGDELNVLCHRTSRSSWCCCCQPRRRRRGETRKRRAGSRGGRQLMSVWGSGADCPSHQELQEQRDRDRERLETSFRTLNTNALVDEQCDVFCCPHHHHHHHCDFHEHQQHQEQLNTDERHQCITPISTLSFRPIPLECQRHRTIPRLTF